MASDRRYWDSNVFLGWLNDEKDKAPECEGVLDAAEEGKVEIVTSALTLTEVIKKKGKSNIALEKEPWVRFDWTPQKLRDVARWGNRRGWRYTPFSGYIPNLKTPPEQYDAQQGLFV